MALMIFSLAAIVLGSAYVNVLNTYDVVARGMQTTEDFAFARQQAFLEPDRKKLEEGGKFETSSGGQLTWSVEIASTAMPDLYNVAFTCEITRPDRPEPDKLTQTFTLLRPTWVVDPGERGKLKEEVKTRILEIQGQQDVGAPGSNPNRPKQR